ncbi:uncharacterized protein BDZ99DRAFT_465936 [Mytilinidion resinicola]|uniref:Uncharacterized protein n=1 Tax=Mytilinidion resinicola TaxID=574789 RepID=A0A6A6YC65_9PEZI|nr:uncharacterized protein BDZ99DRAFT_465936 [Mytilinidion resinicola]KAF2806300.1 hypothetical protein BDZ99DRAFT_465936 [Mytilinidion resinicola]
MFNTQSPGQFTVKVHDQSGEVILDVTHAFIMRRQLIENILDLFGVDVKAPGSTSTTIEASWQKMSVVDPLATVVSMIVMKWMPLFYPSPLGVGAHTSGAHVRRWSSNGNGLRLGELLDQVLKGLASRGDIDEECETRLSISDSTRYSCINLMPQPRIA